MIVARLEQGRFHILDRYRAMVRLAAGLNSRNGLDMATQVRAFEALKEFQMRLRHVPVSHVRVVGTSALRSLSEKHSFVKAASNILGLPIDIIPGSEEARLINLGVDGVMKKKEGEGARLVIDIGGASTEILIGDGPKILAAESLSMGCVPFSQRFFPDGQITERLFEEARREAENLADPVFERFKDIGWLDVIGTSGTIKTIRKMITLQGWGDKEITPEAVHKVTDAVVSAGHLENLQELRGLPHDRIRAFPGGLAILESIMHRFGIPRMRISKAAMREGILLDLARNKDYTSS